MKAIRLALLLAVAVSAVPASPGAAGTDTGDAGVVYVIPIKGMIEPALLYVIRRGVSEAEIAGAKALIFVMDTPGGTVDAASEIVRTIQKVRVPTYTFVEKNAFSAGAIIALATRNIYMAPGSVIGDAMPIMMSPIGGVQEMSEDMKEKAVSGVAALVRSAAETGGHDKQLAEKMVRREIEFKLGKDVLCPAGQLLTLTNLEAERPLRPGNEPLLSRGTVRDLEDLLRVTRLDEAEVVTLEVTVAERIARFIAMLAPIFLMAGLLGIYIEIKTPGFGLPGILGIVSLAVFFWGHHIAGLAGMEDILVFALGAVLLLVEILFIPGFGLMGVAGILLMLWAILSAMIQRAPGGPWVPSWPQVQIPLLKLSVSLIGTTVFAALLARFLPASPLFRHLVLEKSTSRRSGFAASGESANLVGAEGVTLSDLRPSGAAAFGDRRLDVITRGEFIAAGQAIRIVETHGSRIIVEAVRPEA